ncbi:MAG: hypothetical protein GY750_00555, partial [Lentisphaerae bacterium]|nr:hypothetical protein [Lentisphaerota bacterium]
APADSGLAQIPKRLPFGEPVGRESPVARNAGPLAESYRAGAGCASGSSESHGPERVYGG